MSAAEADINRPHFGQVYMWSLIIIGVVIFHWLMRDTRVLIVASKMPWWLLGINWSVIILLLILSQESSSAFIYFQF